MVHLHKSAAPLIEKIPGLAYSTFQLEACQSGRMCPLAKGVGPKALEGSNPSASVCIKKEPRHAAFFITQLRAAVLQDISRLAIQRFANCFES